ncbi:hypothetical protein JCM33374_g97 [Metschnikowia sp. JCM 33374]|nr:hypothetical protein JCM33374_g97 [Metschnikowia sp. JCM 33374]
MFDLSPVSSSIAATQNQNQDFRHELSSGSLDQSLEPPKPKISNFRVLHPNTSIPGRWWGFQSHEENSSGRNKQLKEKKIPFAHLNPSSTHLEEESSVDEFFETSDNFVRLSRADHFTAYNPLSSALEDFDPEIKPHMTEPLLPDGSPLDFSPIEQYRGETNIFSTTPLARVWEFNSVTDKHEYSILNILADEFESLDEDNDSKPGWWSQFRKLTVGLSEDEYDSHYPWAKYCIRSLSDGENEDSDATSS